MSRLPTVATHLDLPLTRICRWSSLRYRLAGHLTSPGFGVDQRRDCRIAAQLLQASAAGRPDAADRDA
jgi:hypothetical protein